MLRRCFATLAIAVLTFATIAISADGRAAENRYNTWGGGDDATETLIERLNTLIDDAERARAADPRFLRDLREALDDYDKPFQQELLFDDFRDGDFNRNPTWTVAEGRFTVTSRSGLRSTVEPPSATTTTTPDTGTKKKKRSLADSLLGALLDDGDSGSSGSASTSSRAAPRAEIFAEAPISNAFSLEIDVASRVTAGRLSLNIFQGSSRSAGYRLAYLPGGEPSFELIRFSSRGASVIDSYNEAVSLEDEKRHRITISRDDQGNMLVSLDGTDILQATDRSFRDPFDGVSLVNDGGDYAVQQIAVYGAP